MKTFFSLLPTFALYFSFSQSVTLNDIDFDRVTSKAFNLSKDEVVKIEGAGAALDDEWRIAVFYGWIIDSESRDVVWHLFDFMDDNDIEIDGEFDFTDEVKLKAGNYEIYYTAGRTDYNRNNSGEWDVNSFNDVVKRVFRSRSSSRFRHNIAEEMYMRVTASSLERVRIEEVLEARVDNAIISFNRVENDAFYKKGFSLRADSKVRLYAVGEGRKDESYDYFWIYDAATREPVFEMDYRETEYGGGAKKNIVVDQTLTLKKGNYIIQYVSDGSHSWEEWNALPPDDPFFWGVSMWPTSDADAKNVIPFKEPKTASPIVDLTKVRDHETVSQGLKVKSDVELRVLCLGEGNDSMVDYGWIINANTRERVWKMDRDDTDYAGGAKKNRKISEVITLKKGDYLVYYTTDGSHAYREWNSSPPREGDLWGISIWATNEKDLDKVETFDASDFKTKNALVEILMVQNDEYKRESFTIDSDTRVRVLALGEGSDGDMYDYAYIKDDTGRRVWEMEYYDTDYAGGARKNREISQLLTLEKGTYTVTYKSDGSHSYGRWNASPPSDQEMWGIVILKEQ
ncbi:MAG: hypothetical protein AAF391_04150 [Bacteroidota bacterium]